MNRPPLPAWLRRAAAVMPLLLATWAFLHAVSFTEKFGLNVPCSDGWPYVEFHEKYNAHTLAFSDLFAMHNEHLFFLPRVLFVAIGALTHVNLMAQQYLSHAELLAAFALIWLATARQFGRRWFELPWWFVPIAFLVFNLGQWRNLICSFQSGFITSVPLSLAAYYFLLRHCRPEQATPGDSWRRAGWFALAAASGCLASFSTATGLAVWPAGGLLLWLGREKPFSKRALPYALGWGLVALVTSAIFAHYYRASSGHGHEVGKVLEGFGDVVGALVRFSLSLLGSPLSSTPAAARFAGAALLVLLLGCVIELVRAGKLRENAFNLACVVQVFATVAMIAVGRIHLGENYSQQSRYITLTVPLWVGTVCVAASIAELGHGQKSSAGSIRSAMLLASALCFATLAAGTAWLDGPEVGAHQRAELARQVRKLRSGRGADHVYVKRWQALGVPLDI